MSKYLYLFKYVLLFLIASCGGGGGGSSPETPSSTTTNNAPFFINIVNEIEVDELQTDVVTVEADDLDGDALRYSLGGNDPSYFSISSQGVITFNNNPSYDVKNEFSISVEVTDNIESISQSLTVFLLKVCNETMYGFKVCFDEENLNITYDRDNDYPTWQDWDNDCQNNRHEVLINEHIDNDENHPLVLSSNSCFVNSGKWFDPYDNLYYYNSSEVQIDHVVALYEAHKSGAWSFPSARKLKFANNIEFDDLLIAVGASSNSKKSAYDPSEWVPSNSAYICEYIQKWLNIKSEFRLSLDQDERNSIEEIYQNQSCSF